jgi:uncharacterized coiled-coil protein SlyX
MMTATQLAAHWKVHPTTIGRAIEKAHLPKARGLVYTDEQVAKIRACLPPKQGYPSANAPGVPHVLLPSSSPQVISSPPARELVERIAQLEAQVALLEKRLAAQERTITSVVNWGRNTARIIRALWYRMPDYQQGDTPGEFPAITAEVLDEGGQETMTRVEEEERRTDAFFAELDQQRESSR